MPTYSARDKGLADTAAAMQRAASGFHPEVRRAMLRVVGVTQKFVVQFIRNPGPGFGPLIASRAAGLIFSWTPHVSFKGLLGRLDSSKLHSTIMNRGRAAGAAMPPREPLENWIRDKRIDPMQFLQPRGRRETLGPKRFRRPRKGSRAEQTYNVLVERAARVLQHSIAAKGIQGRFYVDQAIKAAAPHVERAFAEVGDWVARVSVS